MIIILYLFFLFVMNLLIFYYSIHENEFYKSQRSLIINKIVDAKRSHLRHAQGKQTTSNADIFATKMNVTEGWKPILESGAGPNIFSTTYVYVCETLSSRTDKIPEKRRKYASGTRGIRKLLANFLKFDNNVTLFRNFTTLTYTRV